MTEFDENKLYEQFNIVCNKCGSDNVSFDCDMETDRGDGESEPWRYAILRFYCHSCKDNDLLLYP